MLSALLWLALGGLLLLGILDGWSKRDRRGAASRAHPVAVRVVLRKYDAGAPPRP